ncbi:PH domain-containing protein [Parabacteroides sp. APC149_11_2_Y6]
MDRVFKSKVGWWYHFAIILVIAGTVKVFLGTNIAGMIIMLLVSMLTLHVLLNTWYKITADGMFIAHCSIFPEKRIPISEITELEATVLPVSSYALSLDRIIIYKGTLQWMLVSPVNKKEFVKLLRKHNPEIKIKDPMI